MNQPAQLAGRRRAGILGAMSQGLTQPAPPRISIKAQRFTLVDAAGVQVPVNLFDAAIGVYLDVIIVGANSNKSKIYYENEYDPTKDDAPTCFSDNGVAPSAQAAVPQSPTCAACPNNVWGSDTSRMTGKPTKACSDRKKLAVIVVNDPACLVYQLQIPPASLKHLAVLANSLAAHQVTDDEGQRPCDPSDVVTRIYFNPAKQGELMFAPQGYREQLAPYAAELMDRADASGVIDVATGAKDQPYQGAIALPNPQVMQALPAPAQQTQAPPPPAPVQTVPQFQHQAPQTQVPSLQTIQTNGGFPTQPAPQQPQQAAPQAGPPPRTRRGGARAGAGRPPQQQADQQAPQPTQAPFQPAPQPAQQFVAAPPAPGAPQTVPFGGGAAPFAGPTGPAPTPAPAAATTFPSNGPAPFQPQAAQPFTGQVPQQQGQPPIPETPAFLQRNPDNTMAHPGPITTGVAQPGGAPAFGMTNGAQPDPALAAALQNAFGAPIPPRQR